MSIVRMIAPLAALAFGLIAPMTAFAQETRTAIFSGGCFWCVESDFDHVAGVLETISGYTGGHLDNPRYEDVVTETTGHRESVKVIYDPTRVTYEELLTAYWHSVDPTDPGGQFCDRGESYTTAIWVNGSDQRAAAEASKKAVAADLNVNAKIVTPILDAKTFFPAEDYHQDYYRKNPVQYNFYRFRCGRNARVDQVWGKTSYLGINHD